MRRRDQHPVEWRGRDAGIPGRTQGQRQLVDHLPKAVTTPAPPPSMIPVVVPVYPDPNLMVERFRAITELMDRLSYSMQHFMADLPLFEAARGGIRYMTDRRQGEEVEVKVLAPGDRVFILEGVFTVYRVDMKAPIPTVWLQELPDSPLYFDEYETISRANETEE